MSASLCWRPTPKVKMHASVTLRNALQKSQKADSSVRSFSYNDIEYFRGLADAGVTDADKIIEAIEEHDSVEIWVEY